MHYLLNQCYQFIKYLSRFFDCLAHPIKAGSKFYYCCTLNLPLLNWFWFVEYCQTSPKKNRYEDDLSAIFGQWHQWPKLHLSLDALSNQKILKGIYYLYFDRDRMSGFEWYGLFKTVLEPSSSSENRKY